MSFGSRLIAAVVIGAIAGCVFAFVLALFLVLGGTDQGAGGARIGLVDAAAVSIASGCASGLIAGLLQNLARWTWGAALVGMAALTPFALGMWRLYGSDFDQAAMTSIGIIVVLIGGGLGAYLGQGRHGRLPGEEPKP